jgi:hypothetical protein
MCGEYRPDAKDQLQPLHTPKGVSSTLSEVWPESPPHGHLHVFVSRLLIKVDHSITSSEWFFFPLVLCHLVMLFPCPVPEWPVSWYTRSCLASPPWLSYDELYNLCLEHARLAPF